MAYACRLQRPPVGASSYVRLSRDGLVEWRAVLPLVVLERSARGSHRQNLGRIHGQPLLDAVFESTSSTVVVLV